MCQRVNTGRTPHRRKHVPLREKLTHFGEIVTCDHIIAEGDGESAEGHAYGIVLYDVYSQFIGSYPSLTKTAVETLRHLREYKGSDEIELVYSDNAGEIKWACNAEMIMHDTCKAGDSAGNGIAEQMVRECKAGVTACLSQAGLPHGYWAHAMEYWSVAWNISKKRGLPAPGTTATKKTSAGNCSRSGHWFNTTPTPLRRTSISCLLPQRRKKVSSWAGI